MIVTNNDSTVVNMPRLCTIQCGDHQWPIVYRDTYNINFLRIEKLQSFFDTNKWRNIHQKLVGKLVTAKLAKQIMCIATYICT